MKQTFITGFILCFFLAVLSFNTSAQEYKYDLNKYYTPDIVRNQLDLNFNSVGGFSNQLYRRDSLPNNTQNLNNLNGVLGSSYQTYKNTRKNVSTFNIDLNLRGQFNNSDYKPSNDSFLATQSTTNLNIGYNVWLYNPKKQFLSFTIHGNISEDGNMNHTTHLSVKTKAGNQNFDGFLRASIGVGFGRIESVEDARQAIYILDELSKKKVLTRQLSDDEIFQFAQQISRVKNKRFLDSRLHLIDEITSVDSFFVSNHLLTNSDASYFTTLYDYWQYGALNSRKSGHEFAMSLSPAVSLSSDNRLSIDSLIWAHGYNNNISGEFSITYNYEKPVSLNWQHSGSVSLRCNTTRYEQSILPDINNTLDIRKYTYYNAYLSGSYYISYYPNTRTNYSVGLAQFISLMLQDDMISATTSPENRSQSRTSFNLNASYYFSPQFRLSGNARIGNYIQNSDNYTYSGLDGGISASFIYSFF